MRLLKGSAALIAICALAACAVNSDDVSLTLEDLGFTNVVTIGPSGPFDCGRGSAAGAKFTATSPNGRQVRGVVCQRFVTGDLSFQFI